MGRAPLLLLAFLALTGCGFRFGQESLADRYDTITVPYALGDTNGRFTAALVKALSKSGAFDYRRRGGQLTLKVEILSLREERIGYRYDREEDFSLSERLVPAEGRLIVEAEVYLTEGSSSKRVLGPTRLSTHVDFDHDYYTTVERAPTFSLGQLDDLHVAREVAEEPLSAALAQLIVEYLIQAW